MRWWVISECTAYTYQRKYNVMMHIYCSLHEHRSQCVPVEFNAHTCTWTWCTFFELIFHQFTLKPVAKQPKTECATNVSYRHAGKIESDQNYAISSVQFQNCRMMNSRNSQICNNWRIWSKPVRNAGSEESSLAQGLIVVLGKPLCFNTSWALSAQDRWVTLYSK